MTKDEKIKSLETAMTRSSRDADGGEPEDMFHHFSGTAPEGLKGIFMEHYRIDDTDYEIFSRAIDLVSECINDNVQNVDGADFINEMIYERSGDQASVYTSTRLAYLNMWNESEVSDLMREYGLTSIADACAIWYDKQTEEAAILINEWVNETEA